MLSQAVFGCDRHFSMCIIEKIRPSPSIWEANFKEKKTINSSIIAKSSKIYQVFVLSLGTISRGLRDVKNVKLIKVILTRNIEKRKINSSFESCFILNSLGLIIGLWGLSRKR